MDPWTLIGWFIVGFLGILIIAYIIGAAMVLLDIAKDRRDSYKKRQDRKILFDKISRTKEESKMRRESGAKQ